MTFFKSFTTVAATAAIALGAAVAGSVPAAANEVQTVVSDTWKPGFFNDGDGNYVRQTITERSDNPRQVTRQESRDGWAPGFYYDGEGLYERMTSVTRKPHDGQTVIVQRDSWAPGYTHDGAGRYTRIIHNDQGAQTAAMPDQDQ